MTDDTLYNFQDVYLTNFIDVHNYVYKNVPKKTFLKTKYFGAVTAISLQPKHVRLGYKFYLYKRSNHEVPFRAVKINHKNLVK